MKKLLLVLAILFFSSIALAQPVEVELHYISPGVKCTGPDGKEARCYDLEGYKGLILTDAALFAATKKIDELASIVTKQGQIIMQQQVIVDTLKSDVEILKGRSERLENDWKACLVENEKFPWVEFSSGLAVGVVAGIALGATAMYFILP